MEYDRINKEVTDTPSYKLQLFVLPFAGGRVSQFNTLLSLLDPSIEGIVIEYAGHGTRGGEKLISNYNEFINDLLIQINAKRNHSIPFALFGYSIGGIFAYDIINRHLLNEMPIHFFIGACENVIETHEKFSQLSEEDFLLKLIELGGVDQKLLKYKNLLKSFCKIVQADFALGEQFISSIPNKKISCPMTVLYNESDTPFCDVSKWQYTNLYPVKFYEYKGTHFFLFEQIESIVSLINSILISNL